MHGISGSRLGRLWAALALQLLACRFRADLQRRSPRLLRDIGVEPHAIEAAALALAKARLKAGSPCVDARAIHDTDAQGCHDACNLQEARQRSPPALHRAFHPAAAVDRGEGSREAALGCRAPCS